MMTVSSYAPFSTSSTVLLLLFYDQQRKVFGYYFFVRFVFLNVFNKYYLEIKSKTKIAAMHVFSQLHQSWSQRSDLQTGFLTDVLSSFLYSL